ncbi:MAG TPA: alkaline phosphatase family protein [Candidatus Acidoferrales bacterium]|jgi:phospholipase C|nr:alkaline phosphatase family protein [Candidatus Acidoferrales bacterium]
MIERLRRAASLVTAAALLLGGPGSAWAGGGRGASDEAESFATTTPIKHVVVIFQENISFDHYFGTYPYATNPIAETPFHAKDDTPRASNLLAGGLLTSNPNSTQPFRMDPTMSVTCDQNHNYGAEQSASDHGLMDKFPENVGSGASTSSPCNDYGKGTGVVMGYFDGNTVTALWNYAQHYAMSDNSYSTMFGPSTVGALNLIAGTTSTATLQPSADGSAQPSATTASGNIAGKQLTGPAIGDPRPFYDDCVETDPTTSKLFTKIRISVVGMNVADLLNAKNITWGWFQGGFAPTGTDSKGRAICGAHQVGLAGDDAMTTSGDYIPHHEPFEYFTQSTNQHHTRPSKSSLIGTSTDGANHQYDLSDFWTVLDEDKLPAVTYLKAAAYQDGHPGYSDPIDEQFFLVNVINALQNSRYWKDTAVFVAYDDSDGWYDHALGPIVNQSAVSDDSIGTAGNCGSAATTTQGQCGYGPRQPLLVISPYARQNYVDHRVTDQSSILRFIEDNWNVGRIGGNSSDAKAGTLNGLFDFDDKGNAPRLILDPSTGVVLH